MFKGLSTTVVMQQSTAGPGLAHSQKIMVAIFNGKNNNLAVITVSVTDP